MILFKVKNHLDIIVIDGLSSLRWSHNFEIIWHLIAISMPNGWEQIVPWRAYFIINTYFFGRPQHSSTTRHVTRSMKYQILPLIETLLREFLIRIFLEFWELIGFLWITPASNGLIAEHGILDVIYVIIWLLSTVLVLRWQIFRVSLRRVLVRLESDFLGNINVLIVSDRVVHTACFPPLRIIHTHGLKISNHAHEFLVQIFLP